MTSLLREPLLLPEDVLLLPVAEMAEEWRKRIGGEAGDFAISRPMARGPSKVVHADAAALLQKFRAARTIVQAVLAYSRERKVDPEMALEEALPLLRQLIMDKWLVPEASGSGKRILTTLAPGSLFGHYRVWRSVQSLDDTELYQARSGKGAVVALKVGRPGREEDLRPLLAREAAVLRHLDGTISPLLLESGEIDRRPFLALEWRSGISAGTAAEEARSAGDRPELLRLLTSIARAYAALHAQGIAHGDVHPRNILVDRDCTVSLIDYGLAEFMWEDRPHVRRGGVSFFYEPEWAETLLAHRASPRATELGEQYSLAAVLYLLATGQHYAEFNLDSETMLRQILELTPLPFENVGADPWPELETVLARALQKRSNQRYPGMEGFNAALAAVVATPSPAARVQNVAASSLVRNMLEELHPESAPFREGLGAGPVCSVNLGAGGLAYALYRLSCARGDPALLARADLWITKAVRDQNRADAFRHPGLETMPEAALRVSPYHGAAGVHLVRALIARAMGNLNELAAAVTAFIATSGEPSAHLDLTLGSCGTVLGSALLLEAQSDLAGAPADPLRALGSGRLAMIWEEVDTFGSLADCERWPNLGMAHGWAGLLYTTLRWHAATRENLPMRFTDRLAQLTACARPLGRGLSIPWRERIDDYDSSMPGWCNGTAGLVHLGCLAHRILGDRTHLAFAEGAAWNASEAGAGPIDLCCGLAGRAYALLAFYRLSGEAAWLTRAKRLVEIAVRLAPDQPLSEHPRHSLYKGELGLALLLAELEQPATARMPLFEEEY